MRHYLTYRNQSRDRRDTIHARYLHLRQENPRWCRTSARALPNRIGPTQSWAGFRSLHCHLICPVTTEFSQCEQQTLRSLNGRPSTWLQFMFCRVISSLAVHVRETPRTTEPFMDATGNCGPRQVFLPVVVSIPNGFPCITSNYEHSIHCPTFSIRDFALNLPWVSASSSIPSTIRSDCASAAMHQEPAELRWIWSER